jgi:hypothetical protein
MVLGGPRRLRTPPGLLPDARHVVVPEGICSSGFPAARATLAELGLYFDPWQVDAASCILGKTSLGLYAADTVLLSIPRQVGKTYLVGLLVFADCIVNPGTLTVWTAHRFKVARETFDELKGIATLPQMAAHIDPEAITTAAGNECIPFRNGSRILFAARERGSIRGFRKVRRLICDEAQILTEAAMSDLAPTQNQAENPQLIMMGTPPKPSDPSETFTSLRDDALKDEAEGTLYIEFSAEPGTSPDDRAAWRVANPSLGSRTPERALVRLRKLLANDDDFLREALGIWDDKMSGRSAIDFDAWATLADPDALIAPGVVFSVATAPDRAWSAINAAWNRRDGLRQMALIEYRPGASWVEARVRELQSKHGGKVFSDTAARGLVARAEEPSEAWQAQAHNLLADSVDAGTFRHGDEAAMSTSVRSARWRRSGNTQVLDRKNELDISPLTGAALALHGLTSRPAGGWMFGL